MFLLFLRLTTWMLEEFYPPSEQPDFAFHTILEFSHGLFPVLEAAGILTGLILPPRGHCWNFKVLTMLL